MNQSHHLKCATMNSHTILCENYSSSVAAARAVMVNRISPSSRSINARTQATASWFHASSRKADQQDTSRNVDEQRERGGGGGTQSMQAGRVFCSVECVCACVFGGRGATVLVARLDALAGTFPVTWGRG